MTQTEEIGADELIKQFRRIKAKLEAMDNAHNEVSKPYKEAATLIKDELKKILDAAGADSVKTEFGTAYKSIKTNVKTTDKNELVRAVLGGMSEVLQPVSFDALIALVLEHLDIKPNKATVEAYVQDNGEQLPGTELSRYIDINIRK